MTIDTLALPSHATPNKPSLVTRMCGVAANAGDLLCVVVLSVVTVIFRARPPIDVA